MTVPFTLDNPPLGYPAELERSVILRDGRRAWIRPLVPDDAPLLAHEIATADAETLYLRFFTPAVRIDADRLRHMTELDYHHRLALAAFSEEGDGIAVIRYEGNAESNEAEVAVTTKRGWRRAGVARIMLGLLEEAAAARGIDTLVAYLLSHNRPAGDLFAAFGYRPVEVEHGIVRVEKRLRRGPERATA